MVSRSQDTRGLGREGGAVSVLRPGHHRQHRGWEQRGGGHPQEWTKEHQVGSPPDNIDHKQSHYCSLLKPDFLLIRQDPRDAGEDFKSALLGFQYGQVPSINSLESVYNFQVSDITLKKNVFIIIMLFRTSHGCMLIFWVSKGNLEKKTFP